MEFPKKLFGRRNSFFSKELHDRKKPPFFIIRALFRQRDLMFLMVNQMTPKALNVKSFIIAFGDSTEKVLAGKKARDRIEPKNQNHKEQRRHNRNHRRRPWSAPLQFYVSQRRVASVSCSSI